MPLSRTAMLLGEDAVARLAASRVAVLGLGGVGGHCAEALARCGVGEFLLIDPDRVSLTNLNRQTIALHSTLGMPKTEAMRARILDVNPQARVEIHSALYLPENPLGIWDNPPDLVADAIDTVTAKVDLAFRAQETGTKIVSCMGAGNKLDPSRFEAADLFETSVCPLCRAMRGLARERGVRRLRVVYSKEPPVRGVGRTPGSVAYVTASAGLLLASEAIRMLLNMNKV